MLKDRLARTIVMLAASHVLFGCSEKPAGEVVDETARPVKVVVVGGASDVTTTRYPAVVDASKSVDLQFQVGGTIVELPARESQRIAEGDLIARLEQADFQSNVASARATFENADGEFQRATRLAEQDAIARSVLEQRRSQRDVAKAQLDSAEKALRDSVIRAPFTGVIASVPVENSESVSAGTVVAKVIDVRMLEATINVPASVIAQAPYRNDRTSVVLESAPNREIDAVLKEASLVADSASQTYSVTFDFDAPDNMLVLPGMNATVIVRSTDSGESLDVAIPLTAVLADGDGQYVWVVGDEMRVTRRYIEVEAGIGETVTVKSGLAAGEQIVGAGGAYLSDGALVTPWAE